MSREMTTHTIPGTDYAASYQTGSYLDTAVYLHPADEPYYRGEIVGTVGHIVNHGAHAYGGQVSGLTASYVAHPEYRSPYGEQVNAAQAVLGLAEWALAR